MDKNIAALLRNDTRTVEIRFPQSQYRGESTENGWSPKTYKYVTTFQHMVGDLVVVEAAGEIKVGRIEVVHNNVDIRPNEDVAYKWVIQTIDTSVHSANVERNREIEETVSVAYRKNLQRSFAQQILAGVEDSDKEKLTKLLGN